MPWSFALSAREVHKQCLPLKKQEDKKKGFFVATQDFIVFKKIEAKIGGSADEAIALLLIPKGTEVYITTYKCRAAAALVCGITRLHDNRKLKRGISHRDWSFVYKVGEKVVPRKGFSYIQEECDSGIHFFLDEENACAYCYN